MKSIAESIAEFFAAENWAIRNVGRDTAFSMTFKGNSGEWTCVAQAFEDERHFVFYSACPVKADRKSFAAVAELITRLNFSLLSGNFEMGYLDGEIRLRTGIEIPGVDLHRSLIDRVVYGNVATMDMYLPAILDVIEKQATPLDAISNTLLK